jgi:hypothetical protein
MYKSAETASKGSLQGMTCNHRNGRPIQTAHAAPKAVNREPQSREDHHRNVPAAVARDVRVRAKNLRVLE